MAKDKEMCATCKLLEEDRRNSSLNGYTSDGICATIKNIVYSRWIFQSRKQEEKESMEHFVQTICQLATDCEYKEKDEMIRDKLVAGIRSNECRDHLITEGRTLTMTKAIDIVTNFEETQQSLKATERKKTEPINAQTQSNIEHQVSENILKTIIKLSSTLVRNFTHIISKMCTSRKTQVLDIKEKDHDNEKHNRTEKHNNTDKEIKDDETELKKQNDVTYSEEKEEILGEKEKQDKVEKNNTESIQEKYEVNATNEEIEQTDVCIFSVDGEKPDTVYATLNVGPEDTIKFKIDTGAQVNVIPAVIYNMLKRPPPLSSTKQRLVSYTGQQLGVKGKVSLKCSYKNERITADFIVADECQSQPILSLKTSLELKLIQLTLSVESPIQPLTKEKILKEYEEVFKGFGGLDGDVSIQLKEDAVPVVHPPRRVPYAIKDKVKEELDRMVKLEVIEKVDEPTDWVNSIVVAEKPNGKLRLCLDPKDLNNAIKRPHYSTKTLEEALAEIPNAKYFSKLDAQSGYWQLKLDDKSSYLTTFNTPHGRYRFKRLPFGLVCAQDYFQMKMDQIFEGIQGVTPLVDDVLIAGSTQEEHDKTLMKALERARERNLKLNPEKLTVGVQQVDYFGHLVTSEGLKPDPTKVNAIVNMPAPTDKKELSTILGMITYLSKFSPSLSETTKPMRDILKDDVEFCWDKPQQDAFEKTKKLISNTPVLTYFDPKKKLILEVDASKHGLGAAIYNDGKPIAFASKALNSTEQSYAQIEKELYAILFGCTRFHQYVYGRKTEVHSDHKPLESIMKKSLSSAPPRLQRMLLQLQKYDINVKHVSGKNIPVSDALSRKHLATLDNMSEEFEASVNCVMENLPVSDQKMDYIRENTKNDSECQVIKYI